MQADGTVDLILTCGTFVTGSWLHLYSLCLRNVAWFPAGPLLWVELALGDDLGPNLSVVSVIDIALPAGACSQEISVVREWWPQPL